MCELNTAAKEAEAMDAVINQLIDLDKQARKMVEEATRYLNDTLGAIPTDVNQFKKTYAEEAQHRIQLIQEDEDKLTQENQQALAQQFGELRDRMDQQYSQHHQEWEDALFARCLGR